MFLVGQLNEFHCLLHGSPGCFSLMLLLQLCLLFEVHHVSFNTGSLWKIVTTKNGRSNISTGLIIKCRQGEVQTFVPSPASPARQTQAVSVWKQGNHGRSANPPQVCLKPLALGSPHKLLCSGRCRGTSGKVWEQFKPWVLHLSAMSDSS